MRATFDVDVYVHVAPDVSREALDVLAAALLVD